MLIDLLESSKAIGLCPMGIYIKNDMLTKICSQQDFQGLKQRNKKYLKKKKIISSDLICCNQHSLLLKYRFQSEWQIRK